MRFINTAALLRRTFTVMSSLETSNFSADSLQAAQSCTAMDGTSTRRPGGAGRPIGWPTFAVAAVIYVGFGLVTWFHAALPWWLLAVLGGYFVGWHGSLQHEAVHGHPSRLPWLNRLLVLPNLWLWLPFETYRHSHIRHHRDEFLTDPLSDPESWYVTREKWHKAGRLRRAVMWTNNTLLGRMLLGPPLIVGRFLLQEGRALLSGRLDLRAWSLNLLGGSLTLAWALGVCGMSFWAYLLFFVYTGTAVTLLRSFAEHQARPAVAERSVIVEASPPLALLYLNNNLHALHHAYPNEPWFRLPALWRHERETLLASNGGYRFSGYAEIAARYLLWPKERVAHPALFDLPPLQAEPSGAAGETGKLASPAALSPTPSP